MNKRFRGTGKLAAVGLALVAAVAMPLSASAHGHGYHGGGYHGWGHHGGGYHGGYYGRGYHHGYWSGGRWIAGAIVTGAVIGLVSDALRPAPVYYDAPVAYGPPRRVIYEDGPPVESRRVIETTRTVEYVDPQQTRYIRDDGYDGD